MNRLLKLNQIFSVIKAGIAMTFNIRTLCNGVLKGLPPLPDSPGLSRFELHIPVTDESLTSLN
jgi:hypothetical protein